MTYKEKYFGNTDNSLIYDFIDDFNFFACARDWDLEYHQLKSILIDFLNQDYK